MSLCTTEPAAGERDQRKPHQKQKSLTLGRTTLPSPADGRGGPFEVKHIYGMIGILVTMGLTKKTRMRKHWSMDVNDDYELVRKCMPRDFFELLYCRFLHFSDANAPPAKVCSDNGTPKAGVSSDEKAPSAKMSFDEDASRAVVFSDEDEPDAEVCLNDDGSDAEVCFNDDGSDAAVCSVEDAPSAKVSSGEDASRRREEDNPEYDSKWHIRRDLLLLLYLHGVNTHHSS